MSEPTPKFSPKPDRRPRAVIYAKSESPMPVTPGAKPRKDKHHHKPKS